MKYQKKEFQLFKIIVLIIIQSFNISKASADNMLNNDNSTSQRAEYYDSNITKTVPYYLLFHKETLDIVNTIKPEVKIWLDTGCGTGSLVKSALSIFPDCMFILSDPSESMLRLCREKLIPFNNRVSFLSPASSNEIELDINIKPEVITAIQSHHYLDEKGRENATSRCYNLLCKNGLFITFENIKPFTTTGIDYSLNRIMKFQESAGKSEDEIIYHRKRFNTEYFPITIEQHISLLRHAGFKTVELFWYSYMQGGFYCIK